MISFHNNLFALEDYKQELADMDKLGVIETYPVLSRCFLLAHRMRIRAKVLSATDRPLYRLDKTLEEISLLTASAILGFVSWGKSRR